MELSIDSKDFSDTRRRSDLRLLNRVISRKPEFRHPNRPVIPTESSAALGRICVDRLQSAMRLLNEGCSLTGENPRRASHDNAGFGDTR
jgi:hypothetical protein